jgi:hypothetical protein
MQTDDARMPRYSSPSRPSATLPTETDVVEVSHAPPLLILTATLHPPILLPSTFTELLTEVGRSRNHLLSEAT